jgi:hypothetical protein
VAVGVRYCVEHQGVANEDDQVCDFSRGEDRACRFRQLYRMEMK